MVKKYFQYLTFFFENLKFHIFSVVALNVIVGLIDGLGISIFIPLIEMISSGENTNNSKVKFIIDFFDYVNLNFNLINVLIFLLTVFFLKGLFKLLVSFYQVKIYQKFIRNIRINLIKLFNNIQYKFFTVQKVGHIQNSLTVEVNRLSVACRNYLMSIQSFALVLTYSFMAAYINFKFTALIFFGGIFTNVIYNYINKLTQTESSILVNRNSSYQGVIIEFIQNLKYFLSNGDKTTYFKKIKNIIKNVEKTNIKIGFLNSISLSAREPLMVLVLVLVIYIQINFFDGSFDFLLLSLLFFYRALQSVLKLQANWNTFLANVGSLKNTKKLKNDLIKNQAIFGNHKIKNFENKICLKKVSFRYDSELILSNINFDIKKNETIAIVGESGSGKSTLLDIISGLLPISEGEISIDNIPYVNLNINSLRNISGYIIQEPVVFDDNLFNNITQWDEFNESNEIKFKNAVENAAVLNSFDEKDLKNFKNINNSGVNLSGGQKQRISIARELYKNSQILFMDEATASLDSETETLIKNNFDNLKGKKTIIIVAHRLSTIRNSDRIVFLSNGKIVSINTFDKLYETVAKFR
ncbi:MAG: ABC transporter ATP-binding protein, partial [Flavobacteriaceae bacterium]